MIETWGATVHRSPSDLTESGRSQAAHPTGSLGIAISEAVEVAAQDPDANYALGSVLSHVCLHQTVIGQESIAQMQMAGEEPDVVIGCVGGGSNFAGLAFPWLRRNLRDGATTRFIGAEPAACPTLTKGIYAYDYGDTVGLTPLMPMYTLGHDFVPPPVHAGGLRYHGDSPLLCAIVKAGLIDARAVRQNPAFEAALTFARTEGIIPAPESAHAIRVAIDEALAAKDAGEERVILFNLSRPWPLRHERLRRVPLWQPRGPRVRRSRRTGRPGHPPLRRPRHRLTSAAPPRAFLHTTPHFQHKGVRPLYVGSAFPPQLLTPR